MTDGIYEIPKNLCLVCGSTNKTDKADHIKEDRAECRTNIRERHMVKPMANTLNVQIESEWHISEDICPKCEKTTQLKHEAGFDECGNDEIYITAERCNTCDWEVIFDDL